MKGRRCYYRGCTHKTSRVANINCKMHYFPKDWDRCRLWLRLCGLVGTPRKLPICHYVCSCHFMGGRGPSEEHPNPLPVADEAEECGLDEACVDDPSSYAEEGTGDFESVGVNEESIGNPVCNAEEGCGGLQQSGLGDAWNVDSPEMELSLNNVHHTGTQIEGTQNQPQRPALDDAGPSSNPTDTQQVHSRGHVAQEDSNEGSITEVQHTREALLLRIKKLEDDLLHREELIRSLRSEMSQTSRNAVRANDDSLSATSSEDDLAVPLPSTSGNAEQDISSGGALTTENSPVHNIRDLQRNKKSTTRGLRTGANQSGIQRACGSRGSDSNKSPVRKGTAGKEPFLSYKNLKSMKADDFLFLTGLSPETFEVLYEFLGGDEVCEHLKYDYDAKTPVREMSRLSLHTPRDRLVMTLVRLRRGVPLRDLGYLVNLSEGTVSRICYTWIRLMSVEFQQLAGPMFVSAAAQEDKPDCFKPFPNLRVIIDGTEIKIQKAEHMEQQSNTYSSYKGCNTVKFLVGISVYGGLSFLSEAYEGSISDKNLFTKSGIMDFLTPGDAVMCDKGFDIECELNDLDCNILIPAYLEQRSHFTAGELASSKSIASARVHVERFIGRVKEFRIIRFGIPNSMLPIVSDLFRVCACLVNFQEQIIK